MHAMGAMSLPRSGVGPPRPRRVMRTSAGEKQVARLAARSYHFLNAHIVYVEGRSHNVV